MTHSPSLEEFFRAYVEQVDGAWDELEPQVYDALLPDDVARQLELRGEALRAAFDPEALQDHPAAQLLAFGNPLLDRIFAHAQAGKHVARVYLSGLNLSPHGLASMVQRGLSVPPGVAVTVLSHRPLHHSFALWRFQATFVSDEKVQQTYVVGTDLHYGRPARHLEALLRGMPADDAPQMAYPDATSVPLAQGFMLARNEVASTVIVAAHERLNELQRLLQRETGRITSYFHDLRAELDARAERVERAERATDQGDLARLAGQRAALDREEQAQINELRRKMALSAQLRLIGLMQAVLPRLHVRARLSANKRPDGEIEVTYDPAQHKLDAVPCPSCGRPTLALALTRAGQVTCADCAAQVR
jgi:hypothetical protein